MYIRLNCEVSNTEKTNEFLKKYHLNLTIDNVNKNILTINENELEITDIVGENKLDFSFLDKLNEIKIDLTKDSIFNIIDNELKTFVVELLSYLAIDNRLGYHALVLEDTEINDYPVYVGDLLFIVHDKTLFGRKGIIVENDIFLATKEFKQFKPFEKEDIYLYIGLNKNLNMTTGKASAQTSHVIKSYLHSVIFTPRNPKNRRNYKTMIEDRKYEQALYEYYRQNAQKVISLAIKESAMLKYESEGYITVRDNGLTEIPPNSLTAVCFGIITKSKKPKFLNRHNLLKNTYKE